MDVPMELSRIIISEQSEQQFIFLREKGGQRSFPIIIGISEALAIDRRLKGAPVLRPMTHDLLASVIQAMGGQLEKVVVSDIRRLDPEDVGQTFIATIYIRQDSRTLEIDARPSDAIALGIGNDTPIFVAEHVLQTIMDDRPSLEMQVEILHHRLGVLEDQLEQIDDRLADEDFLADNSAATVEKFRRRRAELLAERDAIRTLLGKLGQ